MHVLEFCLAGAKKQLHYLSSLSVFVDTDHNTGLLKETDSIQLAKQVYGGYAQSKWAAEYVVSSLPREVCIVSIYRLGLICGDTQSGRLPGKDILSLFLQDASRQKTLPYDHDETMAMDVTPVDTASNIITQLIMHGIKSDTGYIYHIANPQSLRWNQLAGFLKQSIHRSAYGTSNGWTQYALCRLSEHAEDYQQFRHMDLFKATKVTFDMQQTKRVIGAVFFPLPTQALINKYIKSACSDQVTLVTSREENHEIYSNTTPS
jgi:thioester reductase-like protein